MKAAVLLLALLAGARPASGDPFVDEVVAVRVGAGGGAGEQADVVGPPHGAGAFQGSSHTLSLGLGGVIVVAFADNVAVDGPGPDLTVFENAFLVSGLTTLPPYAEPGTVSVSADGVEWRTFPCALADAPYYPGCAGVYPVFADADDPLAPSPLVPSSAPIDALVGVPFEQFAPPAGSGGDVFDLAAVGLRAVRFLRIEASQLDRRLEGLSGFDLDAVAALHSVDTLGASDTDADGIPDAADGCPSTADGAQVDTDGDGAGDACDRCPAMPDPMQQDRDADGRGDACDNCPSTPNADQRDADGDGVGDACPDDPDAPPPDTDRDGVPDAADVCPAVPDPAQADRDGDGVGDACDNTPEVPNPGQRDRDGDGAADVSDPCPDDAQCGPWQAGRFTGARRRRRSEALLTYVEPEARRYRAPAGTAACEVVVAVSPDVVPDSVRVRVQGRDVTATLPPFVPGSTRRIRLPLAGRRTRVELRATGPGRGGRRAVDRDRFTFVVR